ncbi:hypothetical protein D3C80_1000050 [compost metagenome]
MRDELARHQIDAAHIDAENAVKFFRLNQFGILRLVTDTGIVDENINLTEFRQSGFHRCINIGFLGNIGSHSQRRIADFACDALSACLVAVNDDDLRAATSEALRHAFAKPRTCSSDERDLTFKRHCNSPECYFQRIFGRETGSHFP